MYILAQSSEQVGREVKIIVDLSIFDPITVPTPFPLLDYEEVHASEGLLWEHGDVAKKGKFTETQWQGPWFWNAGVHFFCLPCHQGSSIIIKACLNVSNTYL